MRQLVLHEDYEIKDMGYITPCHIWLKAVANSGKGYPTISCNGKQVTVHVQIYIEKHGYVPLGKELDHLCRIKKCINEEHLEAVSQSTNMLRAFKHSTAELGKSLIRIENGSCKRGHKLTQDNIYKNGKYIQCKKCKKEQSKSYFRFRSLTY